MATANKVFVSPGVYTSERDLSFVAQSVGVTTLGIAGETLQGPAFEPIFVTNFDEFAAIFGGTAPTKFVNTQIPKYEAAYIAKAYLQQSNQLFVTRVLGLSGYDAGPSWSIVTIANVDPSTITATSVTGVFTIDFTGTTGSTTTIDYSDLPGDIQNDFLNSYTLYDGSTSSFNSDFDEAIVDEIGYFSQSAATSGTTAYIWGALSASTYNSITGASVNTIATNSNIFGVDNIALASNTLSAATNDPWYYATFDHNATGTNSYSGYSFGASLTTIGEVSAGVYSGQMSVYVTNFSGTPISDYDDLVIATFRSRGLTSNSSAGPVYTISGTTGLQMVCTGAYSGVSTNPFATFQISGVTDAGENFTFDTSFTLADTNYMIKVFGTSNFAKPRTEVPVFVEEIYQTLLTQGYNKGYIRGLNCDLVELPLARNNSTSSIAYYLEQFQTPETPYLVSELRGNVVYRLFKFILVSDGNAANRQVKISIANLSFNNGTFDVIVRSFFDTDANPVVIEKFTNCNLNPSTNGFVAKKIGTANGEFELKSRYIMVEMDEQAPIDALPCGFEGYVMREYASARPPFVEYKTQYYAPGQIIYNPPFGTTQGGDNSVRSSGDKIRRTYLGISDTVGYDPNFFDYKGVQILSASATQEWDYQVKGFHMDSGATVVTISGGYVTSGTSAFEVGVASFQSDPTVSTNPYYSLAARKFTLLAQGGFDGWDIYREYRTNGDNFALGQPGFLAGATSSNYPGGTGWGQFRTFVGPNQENWANTDYYAYLWGQQTFANPEAININVFVTPGIDYVNNSNLVEDAIDMIETDRADSIYIMTTPDYNMFVPNTTSFDTDFIYPQEAVDTLEESGIDSNYTATYYPWILVRDGVNNTQIYIPPTSEVVRNLALTDNIAFPWFAAAGYTRGLVNAVKARKKLTQEDRDTLYVGRINPIATFSDVGTVIWGNKTTQIRESALDRINVRRLLLQARKLISAVAVRLLFEQNDDKVRQEFLDSVNPILDSIRRDRGLIDFRVVVSSTPEDLDANQLVGKIYLKPTRALEFIDIEFLITPTGASFEDI
jgi:hypothetical protein